MKKRLIKKTAKRFLAGGITPAIREELASYGEQSYYDYFATFPAKVEREIERIGAGDGGRFDTPLFLGSVNFATGKFAPNPNWGTRWDTLLNRAGREEA